MTTNTLSAPGTHRTSEVVRHHVLDVPVSRTGRDRLLLATKLEPPVAGAYQVLRDQIVETVCSSSGAKLVLLHAPAGFGKTTAMLQCRDRLEATGVSTAWLTLDRADNDASRFIVGLEAAISDIVGEHSEGGIGEPARGATFARGETALDLVARLHACQDAFALFLDELDTIREPGIFGVLRELVDNLPRRGRLVIGSRSLPDLLLGRLRARGQLLEIDSGHLRFSLDDSREFLNARRGIALAPSDLERLHRKAEGWPAALWLASLAVERSATPSAFIDRFSGADGSISDYLGDEVLARQSSVVRGFLLRTSILRHLEASLCHVVVPDVDSESLLHELAATDVLLVSIGEDHRAYRYHSLLAGFLRAQLDKELPGEAARLHAAIAKWYASSGRPVPAIDHAIDGGDLEFAIRLMAAHAPGLLGQGRMRLLARWFSELSDEALERHPMLQVISMWATGFTRGPWEAMEMLRGSALNDCEEPHVAAYVRALRPTLLAMMDQYEEAYDVGCASLARLPSSEPFADSLLANTMATIVAVVGERQEARRLIDAARQGQGANQSLFNQMYSEAGEGLLDLQEGRLKQALSRFRIAVTATRASAYGHTGGNAFAGVPYAAAVYEAGDLDKASQLLQVYLPMAREIGLPDHVMLGHQTQARIAFARGDVDQAWQCLHEFEYVGYKRHLPRVVAAAKLERARLLLLQGHKHAAREEIDRSNNASVWHRVERLRFTANEVDDMEIARLRWEVHAGDASASLRGLESARRAAIDGSRELRALKLGVLQVAALYRAGDSAGSVDILKSVLRQACDEGFFRMILDEGECIAPPLRMVEASLQGDGVAHADPVYRDYVHRLSQRFASVTAAPEDLGACANLMLDPLTRKEIRVLQLAAEGYSNLSMAEKLFVSESTVRTHLRSVNTKLATKNRTQAVAVARRLGQIR